MDLTSTLKRYGARDDLIKRMQVLLDNTELGSQFSVNRWHLGPLIHHKSHEKATIWISTLPGMILG